MENIATVTSTAVPDVKKEEFHEFLRSSANIFTKNIYETKDDTFKKLYTLTKDKDIIIIPGEKETISVIMDKADYVTKVDKIIQDGIRDNKYEIVTNDRTAKDLHNFQHFLYRNFKKHDKYRDMYPSSHQPARFFGTAKTHKFENIESINKD